MACNGKIFFQISDKLCEMGISGKFVNNELISIHGFKPVISTSTDTPTQYAGLAEVNIFHFSQSFILDDPIVRSIVSESNTIFYSLQIAKDKTNDFYLQTSRVYRSTIRSTLNKLQEACSEAADPDDIRKYRNYITIFYSIECLWHLCEFLLIDNSTVSVVPNLLEWVTCSNFTSVVTFQ